MRGALAIGDAAALGAGVQLGGNSSELFVNLGLNLGNAQRLMLTGGQLRQKLEFAFPSGKTRADMTQNSAGASWRLNLGNGLFDYAEATAYAARTASLDLNDVSYAIDTATLYELWNDPRRIAGGSMAGLQGKLGLRPWNGGRASFGFGQERLRYDLLGGAENHNRATGSLGLEQAIDARTRLKFGADAAAAQNRTRIGLDHRFGDIGTLGIDLVNIRGRDSAPNDNRIQLSWTIPLGKGAGALPAVAPMAGRSEASRAAAMGMRADNPDSRRSGLGSDGLLDQVAMRPAWMPAQVIAKLDTTAGPVRLIAVDKTALPAGSTVDTVSGAITAPLGVAVTGIAGVTKNGGAFVNAGQFALTGNSLVIDPALIVQPAVGIVDIYVVTANNLGGGTTLITINVSRGSVRIDSITVSAGADVTAPPTPATLALTGNAAALAGFTNTQSLALAVAAVADPSGVSWFVSESSSAPAVGDAGWSSTQPTTFTLSAGDGAKSVYVYVKDNVGNVQATGKSASIALDTALPTIAARAAWGVAASGATIAGRSVTFNDTAGGTAKTVAVTASSGSIANLVPGAFGAATTFDFVAPANNSAAAINVTITYSVTDKSGNVSSTTDTVSVAAAVPATPTGLSFTGNVLSWNAVPGAVSYNVDDVDASTSIYTGAGTSFDVIVAGASPGETLSVTATNAFGITSAAAQIVVP